MCKQTFEKNTLYFYQEQNLQEQTEAKPRQSIPEKRFKTF